MAKEKSLVPERDEWDIATDSLMTAVMTVGVLAMIIPILPIVQSMQKFITSQEYHGVEEPRILSANSTLQWIDVTVNHPGIPWVGAFIINDGPNIVEVGINHPSNMFTMNPRETITVNRSGAMDERIYNVYYKCSPGASASLRVTGTY